MSHVYLVESGCPYEGGSVDAVYASFAAARQWARWRLAKPPARYDRKPTFWTVRRNGSGGLTWTSDTEYVAIRKMALLP